MCSSALTAYESSTTLFQRVARTSLTPRPEYRFKTAHSLVWLYQRFIRGSMSKTAFFIAILFPSVTFAGLHPVAAAVHTQQPEQSRSERAVGAHDGAVFDRLSMGPDPGGHTGATVTPDTTKTGQPTADRPGGANQSSGSSTTGAGATSGSETRRQQPDSTATQPAVTSGASSTSSPNSGQPGKDR
jgi:hypothetical protein